MPTSLQEAAIAKYVERRGIRRSLTEWCRHCGFEPPLHQQLHIQNLEAVCRGDILRYAVFMPPGSAKSTYSSVLFPPWYLALRENTTILTASNTADLAVEFGGRCRDLITSNDATLGYSLSRTTQAKNYWATSHGCRYYGAGVGGKIVGRRADLGVIDDPIGDIADADSLLIRETIWSWYEWNFLTRLTPKAAVVIISTRWHEDDLMGRIIERDKKRAKGPEWTILSFPMEAEHNDVLGREVGERLWPEYFTQEMVDEAKSNPRKWNGAYQQRPAPEQGDYFKKEWLLSYEPKELPQDLQIYCASDHACSEEDLNKNDPTLLLPFGVDSRDNIYILPDAYWMVTNTGVVVDEMLATMKRRKPLVWVAEKEHITKSIGPFLRDRMQEERTYVTMEELSSGRDKVSKCRSIQGKMQMRKVFFPKFADWWPKAEHELLSFPVGTHDEFPDVLGSIGRFLDRLVSASPSVPKREVKPMTLGWLKASHKRKELEIEALLSN